MRDRVSINEQVGNVAFRRVEGRGFRIVKAKDIKTPEQMLRDHEIAVLRFYAKKYPEIRVCKCGENSGE